MKSLLLATTVFVLSVGTAAAQDVTYDWSGAYVGVQAGYGWGRSDTRLDLVPDLLYLENEVNPDGAFGGLYAGYNFQMNNNVVLGLDADINAANLRATDDLWDVNILGESRPNTPLVPLSAQLSWSGAARARLGYAFDRFLPYIATGVSFGGYRFHIGSDNGDTLASNRSTRIGWNVGAGMDYAVSDRITLRGEYRYTDYGSEDFQFDIDLGVTPAKIDFKTHDIHFGIAYKF